MRRLILITICCLAPLAAFANPANIDGTSLLAFSIVAFWAFVVEAGIVALLLCFRGTQTLRVFMAYFLANAAVFFFVFQPLLGRDWPVPTLEFLVVGIDALAIKLLVSLEPLQSESYRAVSWLNALAVSLTGNAASYFVGVVASRKPWIES
jgi:hypothetical protein